MDYAEIVLGFLTLVFVVFSALAVYSVFLVALHRRSEMRSWLAQAIYWYGILVLVASVSLIGVPLVLKIVALVWRF